MSEATILRRATKEICAFMHALQSSQDFHETRTAKYHSVMEHYRKTTDPNKSVAESKKSLFRFKLDPFISKTCELSGFKYYLVETVSFPPLKVRYALRILKKDARLRGGRSLTVDLELVNLRPYQDEMGKTLIGLYGSIRKARTKLGPQIRNTIIISWNTSEDDIFIQLLILAHKGGLISDSNKALSLFRSYTHQLQQISSTRDLRLKKDLAADAFAHLLRCYSFPIQEYSFKKYISMVIYGLKKMHRSAKFRASEASKWKKGSSQDNNFSIDEESLNIDDFQTFKNTSGSVTFGVDRAAFDTGLSRDTIYRYIRKKKIKSIQHHKGNRDYRTIDAETIQNLRSKVVAKKHLINLISQRREITKDSARKRVLRLKQKGLDYEEIYKYHS